MNRIQFSVSSHLTDESIQLEPGQYEADLEMLDTDPVQYRVFNLSGASGESLRKKEDQLILIRTRNAGLDTFEWREVFNNTSSKLAQVIGEAIEQQVTVANG